ncbi:tyrosine-type recombinase/integrase [Cypionkella sp.]|uniref:tyrosine-type recombinase/integrase n=1 Tax=Cypionkella sp. TaxID=2811411 RepID=UPI002609C51D|nr:tyrosine-type recombinase/integrase [Cypionkella sp.]
MESQTYLLHVTKNGLPRTVPLSVAAIKILKAGTSRRDSDPAFAVTENAFRLSWQRVQARSGIEDFRSHDLRHEAVSRFFERGLSHPEVALISGHRELRPRLRYTHLNAIDLVSRL